MPTTKQLSTVHVAANAGIAEIVLARPSKLNAFDGQMWQDFKEAFTILQGQEDVRVVLIHAQGKSFCAGIDLTYFAGEFSGGSSAQTCPARERYTARHNILKMQDTFNAIEQCPVPVIVAIHGACVGAGVDLACAADIRVCSQDATFSVKEVDVGITADLGTLQRLPHIVGYGAACDLCLTGRKVMAQEALALWLVSAVHPSQEAALTAARQLAASIAAKSPLAVAGTKRVLQHARDHCVSDGLEYVATYNAAMLLHSSDAQEAVKAAMGRRRPVFAKL